MRNSDANNHIAVHHQLTKNNIDWDSAQCLTYSTNYFVKRDPLLELRCTFFWLTLIFRKWMLTQVLTALFRRPEAILISIMLCNASGLGNFNSFIVTHRCLLMLRCCTSQDFLRIIFWFSGGKSLQRHRWGWWGIYPNNGPLGQRIVLWNESISLRKICSRSIFSFSFIEA